MRSPLILTGAPAVGKTTAGRLVAESRERCAFIDVDDLRQLVVSGHLAPWEGVGGLEQQRLGVANACGLVASFATAGIEAVVADVVTPATAARYREALTAPVLVHLRISLAGARSRMRSRPRYLTAAEFDRLHQLDRNEPPPADAVLEVDGLSIEEQVHAVERLWATLSGSPDLRRSACSRRGEI